MKSIVVPKFGSPDVMLLAEGPDPEPGEGEIRIAVKSAGVNFADVLARLGVYKAAPKPPFTPGIEVSGEVERLGSGVKGFSVGDRVVAFCEFGGYAEKAVAAASATVKIPPEMGYAEASAILVQYLTAHYGLFRLAGLRRGEALLVHAAAGGVGIACLQLCKEAGVKLFSTVSTTEKEAVVKKEFPAARVIRYEDEDFSEVLLKETGGRGADVVMDSVGGKVFRKGWNSLAPGGRYILFGAASAVRGDSISKLGAMWRLLPMSFVMPLRMISENRGLLCFNLFFLAGERDLFAASMEEIFGLWRRGVVKPRVSLALPLEKATEAHRRLQGRSTFGKLILTVG